MFAIRLRTFASALGIVSLLAPSFASAATHMYVIEGDYDRVRIIDTDGYDLLGVIDVGDAPGAIVISGTGAYVANSGADTVTVIDVTDNQVVTTVSVGDAPRDIVVSGTGAFVVNGGANTVTVIDITDNQVVSTVNVGTSPRYIAASGTGVYVTNNATDTMTIIDITDNQVAATVSVGDAPVGIAISGTGAYVALNGEDAIKVIDITDNLSVKTIAASGAPELVAITGTSLYYSITLDAQTRLVDVETEAESAHATPVIIPRDIVINADRVYVMGQDYIHILEASTVTDVDSVDAMNMEEELEFADFDGLAFYSDTTTLDPTLIIPASVSLCDDLAVQYVIPEEILAGTVQLQFYNETTHTSVTATLNNSSGSVSFNLNLEDFTAVANVVSSTSNSIIAGEYTVYLSYRDQFGNAAAQDEDTSFTVTACASSSSSSSSSESSLGGGGGGGCRGSACGAPPPSRKPVSASSSSSSSSRPTASSSASAASSVTKEICANVENVSPFKDVDASAWYHCYSKNVAGLKIFEGYKEVDGTPKMLFGPSDNITLGQLAKVGTILRNKEDLDPKPTGDKWYEPYVGAVQAYDAVVFTGNHDPLQNATRAQVILTILEALQIPLLDDESPYADVDESTLFWQPIVTATKLGIVSGDEGTNTFRPNDPVNRAEVAKMLSLALAHVGIMYEDEALDHAAAGDDSSSSSVDATVCTNVLPRNYPVRATPSLAGAVAWYLAPAQSVGCDASSGGWTKVYGGNATEGYVQNIAVGRR